ncbi:16456_t:CDS:2, partial [Funneliformis geosporum]
KNFLEFPPREIIGSKAQQQHLSISVEDHSSTEQDRKRRKLDHLIDSTGDGSGSSGCGVRRSWQFLVEIPEFSSIDWNNIDFIFITNYNHMQALPYITEYTDFKGKIYATEPTVLFARQMMKELVHFFGDSALLSRTHSQPGSTNIFTGVTSDWNVARSLYSIADIQSCIDKVRPVRFGEHLIVIISSSSTIPIHPLPFDEAIFNDNDVVIFSDLRDEDSVRFENILMEIGQCVAMGFRGIPFYAVSPIAEESLKYSNICGEWLINLIMRQQKMYLPDDPMPHQDMIEQMTLYNASRADSTLQEKYQEPCVIFAGHPSL